MIPESFDEIISHLKRPIEFASKDSFAHLNTIRDLESAINAQIEKAISFLALQPSVLRQAQDRLFSLQPKQTLMEIKENFKGFDSLSLPEKKERLKTAQNLLNTIKESGVGSQESGVEEKRLTTYDSRLTTDSIQFVKGVGEKRAKLLSKLDIQTIEDALYFIPMRYEDRSRIKKISELKPPSPPFDKGGNGRVIETVCGTVFSKGVVKTKRGRRIFEVAIKDETGIFSGKWFKFNERYMNKRFSAGQKVIMSGEAQFNPYHGGMEMIHPDVEILDSDEPDFLHVGRIVPIYHSTEGIHQKTLRTIMKGVIDNYADSISDFLPDNIKKSQKLLPLKDAVKNIHFPEKGTPMENLNSHTTNYHRRLIFDEFFLLEIGLAIKKRGWQEEKKGIAFKTDGGLTDKLLSILPFKLTGAQERVINEIKRDL
ncbi:MAG: hypothetical protein HY279_02540, partial [Nitrospinae bacterium]|nr:hypothetical protein [Nitrospinota bacterium]